MQNYSTPCWRNWSGNHNFVPNPYVVTEEPCFKGLWFLFFFFPSHPFISILGEFFIFSLWGLPYCDTLFLAWRWGWDHWMLPERCLRHWRKDWFALLARKRHPHLWQWGGTAACVIETSISQMNPRRTLRRVANAVLSTPKVHPEILQTTDDLKQATSLYTPQPANKCDRTIQSHFSLTNLCKY